jgi:pyruvate/2-oxoglutarate dehydrogenase complex dihydrolipoamide acyltransferase (E2) component
MRPLNASSIALVFGLLIAAPVVAQESPVAEDGRVLTSAAMDAALAGHESAVDQQRAELARLLSQPQVQRLADDHGIDIGQVESAAAGLSDSQMEQIAPLVAMVTPIGQNALGTVTISVAAIIIILLILILVT